MATADECSSTGPSLKEDMVVREKDERNAGEPWSQPLARARSADSDEIDHDAERRQRTTATMSSSSPPPSLLAVRSVGELVRYAIALLTDPRYFSTLACLVLLGDAVLTQLVIRFVPCKYLVCWSHACMSLTGGPFRHGD